jgi:hypothetical protein
MELKFDVLGVVGNHVKYVNYLPEIKKLKIFLSSEGY